MEVDRWVELGGQCKEGGLARSEARSKNAKRKFRAYYGKDYTRIATEGLQVGDFIRLRKKHLDLVSVPEFKRKNAPRLFFPKPSEEPEKRVTLWQAIKSLF